MKSGTDKRDALICEMVAVLNQIGLDLLAGRVPPVLPIADILVKAKELGFTIKPLNPTSEPDRPTPV
jgi:hypothetical protein